MAIELNDNIDNKSPKILDKRYSVDGVTPYVDVAEANATIPLSYRAKGLTVLIGNQEYWYKDGIQDVNLVPKGGSTDFCTITLHKDVVVGPDVNFVHTDNGTEVDNIDTDVSITRAVSQPIFNIALEASYQYDISPQGTLWNADGWGSLADLQNRNYLDLANCLNYNIGNSIVGTELVMWDTINNKYYKFLFTQWTQGGGGGGFAYTRNLVTQTCDGTIHFDDGSTLDTAPVDTKNIILVDSVFGDDTTAQPYNMLKPFKTINKAHDNAKSGDLIYLNPSPSQYLLTGRQLYTDNNGAPLFVNYYISAGAVLSAVNGGSITYNRILVRYNNLVGGNFAVGGVITVNGCALGSIVSVDTTNNVLEIASGNQVMTPTFTVGNIIDDTVGVTASLVSCTKSTDPENNLSITGEGSLVLRGMSFIGGYNGTFTINVNDLYVTNLFYYGQATYGTVNINCNKLVLIGGNGFFYFDNTQYNYGGIGLVTYTNQVGTPFVRGTQISNGAGVTAYVLQDDGAGYINIYNIQGGNFSNGDTITDGATTATISTSTLTTTPIAFNLNAKSVVVNPIIFGIFPAGVACNWNIGTYRKPIIESSFNHQIWFYGGVAPQFEVISNVNINDLTIDASTSTYAQSIFYMATGQSLKGKYFIKGYYKYSGGVNTSGQTTTLIQLNGNTIQYIEFNGTAILKNSGFINEISNYAPNYSFSQIVARGNVTIDNSQTPVYWGLIWSGIQISNSKLKMYADLIYDSPINFAILLGNYTSNETALEVDLIDCQIINKNQASLLPVIGVGYSGGSSMLPPLTLPGKLPIKITYALGLGSPDFVNGETINNGGGVTGVVSGVPNGMEMYITTIAGGQFNVGDTIDGGTSGATATITEIKYWGTLRLKNAVIVGNTLVQNSIEGAWPGQPNQVYTGYSNKPQLNMINVVTGTNYIVDSDINSNNF